MTFIEAPSNCPSCDSVLEDVNSLLYCRNPNCGERSLKLIEHFAKTLKVKGLGAAAIKRLSIVAIEEMYNLTLEEMEESSG